MQNGYTSASRESAADIKNAAKEAASKVRGATPASLLKTARDQVQIARVSERDGDFKASLSYYTKATALVAMCMDTTEFKQEMHGKKGILTQEWLKFQQVRTINLTALS